MSGQPRFEVVRSDAGWFARFVAANGAKVWQTEVYVRRRGAWRAIALIESSVHASGQPLELREIDERSPKQSANESLTWVSHPSLTGTTFGSGWWHR